MLPATRRALRLQREMPPALAWESLPMQSIAKRNGNLLRLEVKA
jgi:hypothetical protein